ncbi:MAG: stage III sporulation protein AF [Clostridiales bacterium GWB2_37_7]|nr:MAG: stage III sporulation protein AF [Clostridiales bacterium GWB2_37_7]
MMEFLKSWITNITVVIIFTMLLDILLPNNDMKKFAKVIIGLLIILVIINPFLTLKDFGNRFQSTMTLATAYIESSEENNSRSIEIFQNNTALNIYKEKLSDKISEIVRSRKEFENSKVRVNVDIENDINETEFGSIKAIQVFVEMGNGKVLQASAIEPVKINTETVINKKQDEYNWNNRFLSQDLSTDISDALGLKDTEIFVQIQE